MSISQGFDDVRARARQGIPGYWATIGAFDITADGINASPQASQVDTVTATGATNDKTYTITVNSVDVSYTADASATVAEIADGLAAAVNAEPLVRGQVAAVSDAVDTLTLTGLTPGVAFTITEADAQLTTASVTTSAEADPIGFGLAVISQGYRSDEGERLVALAKSSLFTPQVATLSIAYVAGAIITVSVYEVRGSERVLLASVAETSATDQDTTIDALVANLEALLPANSVAAAADAGAATAIVFTAEVAGLQFAVEHSVDDSGASIPAITLAATTGPSLATSLHMAFVGASLYSEVDPTATIGGTVAQYAGNSGVVFAQRGELSVESDEAPTEGGTVYVELAAGATAGRFYAADSATRVALPSHAVHWSRDGITAADSLAAIRLGVV